MDHACFGFLIMRNVDVHAATICNVFIFESFQEKKE
jgi:hypothetical protein